MFSDAPAFAFATANGTVVGQQRKQAGAATTAASCPLTPASPAKGALDHSDRNHDGGSAPGLCTPGADAPVAVGYENDEGGGSKTAPVVTPFSINASPTSSSPPPPPLLVRRLGEQQQQQSPESRAAAEAAQMSLAVVRQSFVRRRGAVAPKKVLLPPPVAGAAAEPASSKRLCSTPFLVRRKPALSPSAAANSDASPPARGARGTGGSSCGTSRPLDLSAADVSTAATGRVSYAGGAEEIGGEAAGVSPDTPRGRGGSKTGDAPPGAAGVVTPAATEGEGAGAAAGARRKKRKERQKPADQEAGGAASSKGKALKKRKKEPRVSAAAAGAGAGAGGGSEGAGPAEAAPAPAPMTVTFSAGGSLGMGLMADVTEEGSMCLAGKSPTSPAAPVPNGWRLIEVDGKSVRRLGGGFRERVLGACGCQVGSRLSCLLRQGVVGVLLSERSSWTHLVECRRTHVGERKNNTWLELPSFQASSHKLPSAFTPQAARSAYASPNCICLAQHPRWRSHMAGKQIMNSKTTRDTTRVTSLPQQNLFLARLGVCPT